MIKRSLFTPVDTLVFASGIVSIAFGLYLYSHNSFNPLTSELGKPVGLHLAGDGTQKNLGNLFWSPLINRSSVYNGDKLFANKNEDLSVKLLKSGMVINIPKESLVVIYEEKDGISFSLDKGQIQIISQSENAKETKVKLKQSTGEFKVLELKPNTDMQIKKSKFGNEVIVNKGEASLVGKNNKIETNLAPNSIVRINKAETIKIEAQDIVKESIVDTSKQNELNLTEVKNGNLEVLSNLNNPPIAVLGIKNGKADVSNLPVGNYFIREEGKSNFDKVSIMSTNHFVAKVDGSASEVVAGEPLKIKWDGREDQNYQVSVITPEGASSSIVAQGTRANIDVPMSGLYKVAITKVDAQKSIVSDKLFNADELFQESKKVVEKDDAVVKQANGDDTIMSTKQQMLSFQKNGTSLVEYVFKDSQSKKMIESLKTNLRQDGFNQQVARTQISLANAELQMYERSNIDKGIPALKKIKYIAKNKNQPQEELILRYDNTGALSTLTLRSGKNVIDQVFEDNKLVKSTENKKEFSGAALVSAASIPLSISAFMNSKMLPSPSNTSVAPNFSALDIKIKSPISITSTEDIIDEKDNYIKKISVHKVNNQDYKYQLENSKGAVIASSVLATQLGLKNLPAGEYNLKVKTPDLKKNISQEKITIKPRVQLITKPEEIDINADKSFAIPLKWNSPAKMNKLEVFKEGSEEPIISELVEGNKYNLKTKSLDGLKWRVSAQVSSVMPSKTEEIVKPEPIKILPVSGPVVMKYQKKLGGCYEFSLPKMKFAQKYFIEVYESLNRDKMVFNRWLTDNTLCWQSSKHGKYFYRYKYFDKWGAQSEFSKMGEIIFPISPLTEF